MYRLLVSFFVATCKLFDVFVVFDVLDCGTDSIFRIFHRSFVARIIRWRLGRTFIVRWLRLRVTRSMLTVFCIPCLSIVAVFGWTPIRRSGPVIRDWSFSFFFFAMASAVICEVARSGVLSKKTSLSFVKGWKLVYQAIIVIFTARLLFPHMGVIFSFYREGACFCQFAHHLRRCRNVICNRIIRMDT